MSNICTNCMIETPKVSPTTPPIFENKFIMVKVGLLLLIRILGGKLSLIPFSSDSTVLIILVVIVMVLQGVKHSYNIITS